MSNQKNRKISRNAPNNSACSEKSKPLTDEDSVIIDADSIANLGESEIHRLSLAQTENVISILESFNWLDISNKKFLDNYSIYHGFLEIIEDRINRSSFSEKLDITRAISMLGKTYRLKARISLYQSLCEIENFGKNTQKTAEENIQGYLTRAENDFQEGIENKIKKATDKIEPSLITTVLTLMGVFSAIITIVMSVVVTSTSWLNNANAASAVIAFIVPSIVVVFSMSILLSIVFTKRKSEPVIIVRDSASRASVADHALKMTKRIRKIMLCVIIVFTTVLLSLAVYELVKSGSPHTRHVLTHGRYEVVVSTTEGQEQPSVIRFEFDGKEYCFQYDEKLIHNGELYFCTDCQKLE